ncbi:MAG TPA: efflux RND transporter periplasmic adaptor subunit [Desulfobacterales bacterium]|nr:efflux RND transporter periplasmic adaptor subunit [Desulfobacterales bacterium]
MNSKPNPPKTTRAKVVYFVWNSIPRIILLCMVLMIIIFVGMIKKQSAQIANEKAAAISQDKPVVNVVTLALSSASIQDRINLPGSIEPWTDLKLLARTNGTVTEVLVSEGDTIKKGNIIARIEEDDYRINLDRARAAYNLAKADFKRDKSIHTKGMIPTADLDAKKTRVQTTKADFEDAKLQFSRCTITAPMDGIIQHLDAKVGLLLSVADPIAEILKINRLKAVIGIPESDVNAVRKLDTVTIVIQALGNKKITARKHFLSSAPETIARLYNLELEIDNSEGTILPGMFVRADIIKDNIDDAIVIPFYTVISRNDEQFVYIEQEGIVKKRKVQLGIMEKWMVEVKDGLKAGDNLLVEGHRDVENDQKIKVVKTITDPSELIL